VSSGLAVEVRCVLFGSVRIGLGSAVLDRYGLVWSSRVC